MGDKTLEDLQLNGSDEFHGDDDDDDYQKTIEIQDDCDWFVNYFENDLKWSLALNSVLFKGTSEFQDIAILDTRHFGKALVIDGKLRSAERDEFIYNECLIHPALLIHDNPRTVFIMGGGEGSAAREALKHKDIEKVVVCDIDQEFVNVCHGYLTSNQEAFCDERLQLVINDPKAELEKREEKFDVIVGDLADPLEGGPCYHLYTKSFYQRVLKPRLNNFGIFVTQAGPAGVLTHKEIFSSVHNTIKHAFNHVITYAAHVPSYADTRGWVLASDQPFKLDVVQIENRIKERITAELRYLDGASILASTIRNKTVYSSLLNETRVYMEENERLLMCHEAQAVIGNEFYWERNSNE